VHEPLQFFYAIYNSKNFGFLNQDIILKKKRLRYFIASNEIF